MTAKHIVYSVKTAVRALSQREYPPSNRQGLANQVRAHRRTVKRQAHQIARKGG
jgi:hypothetical protein